MELFAFRVRALCARLFAVMTPHFRQLLRFCGLPYCLACLVDWRRCRRSPLLVALDHLYIFFVMRYFPDNYSNCRLYARPRADWPFYYGSSYHPFQRGRLRRRVQPREYQVLFEDKEVCQQLCAGAGVPVAEAVGVLTPYAPLDRQIEKLMGSTSDDRLIAKPVSGASGAGIFFIERNEGAFKIRSRGQLVAVEDVVVRERVLVQRLVRQHGELSRLYPRSVNTLRILTLLDRDGKSHVLSTLLRCGVGEAAIDNWSAGGIAIGVDPSKGELRSVGYDKHGREFMVHPDSGVAFEGYRIPSWDHVGDFARSVQEAFAFHPMLGLDVAVCEHGLVVIELNAFPDFILQEQASGPLLADPRVYRLFADEGLLFSRAQLNLHGRGAGAG